MSLRWPYGRFRTPLPVVALGGQSFRPRPVIMLTVVGPSDTVVIDVLLDTGADDTTFPEKIAADIGLDLTHAPTRYLTGIGPAGYRVRYADVRLRLTDGIEFRDWPITVAFTNAPLPLAALGFAGGLQFFTAAFHGDREEVELTVNALDPGS